MTNKTLDQRDQYVQYQHMDNEAMTEFLAGQSADDYRDQCDAALTTQCDECGIAMLRTEKANPTEEVEVLCVLCMSAIEREGA